MTIQISQLNGTLSTLKRLFHLLILFLFVVSTVRLFDT